MEIQENNDEIFDIEDFISDDEDDTNGYENGCIYRIYCKDNNIKDEYNGSTKNLEERLDCHIRRCNNNTNSLNPSFHSPLYIFMRQHGGIDNWIIEKLYDYPCNSEEELTDEEDRYVRNNPNATLQGKKVKLTEQEKNNYNKDRYALLPQEKKDEYYAAKQKKRQDNKEYVNKLQRENRANRSEEKKEADKIKAQEKHKNKMENETEQEKKERLKKKSEKNKSRVNCPYCNKEFAYASLRLHKKTCPNRPKE